MQVIGQRPGRLLIALDDGPVEEILSKERPLGRVLNLESRELYQTTNLHSLLTQVMFQAASMEADELSRLLETVTIRPDPPRPLLDKFQRSL